MNAEAIISGIEKDHYHIAHDFFSEEELKEIIDFLHSKEKEAVFRQAGIGQQQQHQIEISIRGDKIFWLEQGTEPMESVFFEKIRELMQALNRTFYLGINDFEFHLAIYPENSFYKKHRDAFKNTDARKISVVCYLNPFWQPGDGGELIIYMEDKSVKLEPTAGTVVIFESHLEHEVLPAFKTRYSLTGWLKRTNHLL